MHYIQKFCSLDPHRSNISKPWSVGEHTIATNGHVMVRVPRLPDVPENPAAPDITKVLDIAAPPDDMRPLPEFTMPSGARCQECLGKGRSYACPECDGEGSRICNACDHERDCDDCDGTGRVVMAPGKDAVPETCAPCYGEGIVYGGTPYLYLSPIFCISARYATWLRELPGLRLSFASSAAGDNARPVPFVFDGGDGLIMPVRPGTPRREIDIVAYAHA